MSNILEYKADINCSQCGRYGAYDFGDENLCSECYGERGSCCLEFGSNDLWEEKNKETAENPESQNSK